MDKYLEQAKKIILDFLKNEPVEVYLFGSRARGDARKTSDIDIALRGKTKLPNYIIVKLKDRLEESSIPYTVDIIDLNKVDNTFKQQALKEAIKWND